MKDQRNRKEILTILVLTLVFGVGAYFLGRMVDNTIANIAATENKLDELTRVAVNAESQAERIRVMDTFSMAMEDNLGGIEDIPKLLQQLEVMASLTDMDLTMSLEEAVIGDEGLEFKDEKKKQEFLNQLEVKEYSTTTSESDSSQGVVNVALTLKEEKDKEEEKLTINYLEVDLVMGGTYRQVRTFISLMENSRYFFNIEEIRMNKMDAGKVEAVLKIRAFVYDKPT